MASPQTASTNGAKRKLKIVKKGSASAKSASPKAAAKGGDDTGRKSEGPRRYKGATSGMSVSEYQNYTLAQNSKHKMTDEQLAANWRKEFPNAAKFTDATVRGVRSLYNRGKHRQDEVPATPSRPYDEDGNAMALRGEKSAAKSAKTSKSEDAPARGKKAVVKKAKRTES